ncbi:TRAP transporter substrate-binding protein [candidate division KSB1 bacterium]|nr:TRAP transporter substrate-binding protein [candidate division KSB1 bacterium]
MKLKQLLSLFFIILLLVNCQRSKNDEMASAIQTLKLSHTLQADFSAELHTAAWIFQQWVEEHSSNLRVRIYAANALGQEREVYEGMQLESGVACALSGTAILNNFVPRIGVLDLPFLWQDYEHVHRALDGEVGKLLAADLEKAGFKVLAWLDSWGYRNVVTADKPAEKAEDLKGLKIRTIQTPLYISTLNAMGANATPMAFGEVYAGMQMGVIDGFEHSASIIKANKLYEVGRHLILTRHLFGPVVFVYAKYLWDKLDSEQQQVLLDAAQMAQDVERALAPIREKEALTFLQANGMTIHPIDRTPFVENAREIQDELARELGATDLLEKIRAAGQ